MYKEKYLKYKTKYLELKSQIGGISNTIQVGGSVNVRNEIEYNMLIIEDEINKISLSINYEYGKINVIDAKYNIHEIYKKNIDIHNYINLDGNNWVSKIHWEIRPIYKKLIQIAINELEKNTSVITDVKTSLINQLTNYIKILNN